MADRQRFPSQESRTEGRFPTGSPVRLKIRYEDGTECSIHGTVARVLSDSRIEINTPIGPISADVSDCTRLY